MAYSLKFTANFKKQIVNTWQDIILKGIERNKDSDSYSLVYVVKGGVYEYRCLLSYQTQKSLIGLILADAKKAKKYLKITDTVDNTAVDVNYADLSKDKVVFRVFIGRLTAKSSGKEYTALLADEPKADLLDAAEQEQPDQQL